MLRATIEQVKSGMRLAMPVYHPKSANRLLAPGFELDRKTVTRLCELEVREVWVEYPNTDEIRDFISPTVLQRQSEVASSISGMFDKLHADTHASIDYAEYKRNLRDLLESILSDPKAAFYIAEVAGKAESDFRHATAVSIISLLMGLRIQGYIVEQRSRLSARHAKNLISLGLGAMFHDIGMQRIEHAAFEQHADSHDDNNLEWQSHVVLGHKMITGAVDPAAAGVVLQHHQYHDGTGFPRRIDDAGIESALSGEDIHIFARIVCVADHLDRLCNPYGNVVRPRVVAMYEMLQAPLVNRFDPVVLSAMFEVVPAYAPGSIVRLNTGEEGIVVDWDEAYPCRPSLILTSGGEKTPGTQRSEPIRYDLRERDDLTIVGQDGVDVTASYFELPESPHADAIPVRLRKSA